MEMYKCCCGKEFETSNQLNLHKGRCKEYLGEERYFLLQDKLKKTKRKSLEAYLEKRLEKKLQKEKLEAAQIHVCERCGKEFIGNVSKYSTNRFCSRSCANKHENRSEESRRKTGESIRKRQEEKEAKLRKEYLENPKHCSICNKELPFELRLHKTCGNKVCQYKSAIKTKRDADGWKNCGGITEGAGRSKKGWYKNIRCDSSYELAYVIYCLDHGINIQRCKEYFEYEYQGQKYKYYPDFVVNNEIVEIKGFWNGRVNAKRDAVLLQNKKYKILFPKDMDFIFKYIEEKYGKLVDRNISDLYE